MARQLVRLLVLVRLHCHKYLCIPSFFPLLIISLRKIQTVMDEKKYEYLHNVENIYILKNHIKFFYNSGIKSY